MKSAFIFMLVATLGFESSLWAAPTKTVSRKSSVLIEMVSDGGYVPFESHGWEHGVRIYVDGRVEVRSRPNDRTPLAIKPLARLDSSLVKKLSTLVKGLKGEVRFNENEPMCVDAASTTYRVGTAGIEFSARTGCRDGYLEQVAARRLRYTLDGLRSVAALLDTDS